jgi:hypothetical protein
MAAREHQGPRDVEPQITQDNGLTSARPVEQGELLSASANLDTA